MLFSTGVTVDVSSRKGAFSVRTASIYSKYKSTIIKSKLKESKHIILRKNKTNFSSRSKAYYGLIVGSMQ
jgi:hypothetical protein